MGQWCYYELPLEPYKSLTNIIMNTGILQKYVQTTMINAHTSILMLRIKT